MAASISSSCVRPVLVHEPSTFLARNETSSSYARASIASASDGGLRRLCGTRLKCLSAGRTSKGQSQSPFCCFASSSWLEEDQVPPPSFADRLAKAWQVVFPSKKRESSVAQVAKERLRLVLYSDREQFHPRLKKKLCGDIVNAMGDFLDVAVEEEDDIEFRVTRDPLAGSCFNVSVPVKRVKPALQK
eukprot:TRINITY_DN7382_c0_g1_i1.p1 TRINITY_DN7382_c0_g1~~TRINITY_DN7382_c0_g1_i1.p1  ORF type:complete len:188 (-),score=10.69 TRINITY_DN7382_c0_g1_i1:300-863(-)